MIGVGLIALAFVILFVFIEVERRQRRRKMGLPEIVLNEEHPRGRPVMVEPGSWTRIRPGETPSQAEKRLMQEGGEPLPPELEHLNRPYPRFRRGVPHREPDWRNDASVRFTERRP